MAASSAVHGVHCLQVKELHTVYIDGAGGPATSKPATRNVGILCKSAVREVGVMYQCR